MPFKELKLIFIVSIIGLFILGQSACKVDEDPEGENPVPVINEISPTSKTAHMASFTLTVEGSDFAGNSVIVFNNITKSTEYVDSTRLTCQIDPDDMPFNSSLQPGVSAVNNQTAEVPVFVRSPEPGGGDSATFNFTVLQQHRFNAPVDITNTTANIELEPAIAIDDEGNISVLYQATNNAGTLFAIDYLRSDDGGTTWNTPVRLVESTVSATEPRIALDSSGNLYTTFFAAGQLYFMSSGDEGASWSAPVALSAPSDTVLESAIAVDAFDGLHIIWGQVDANFNTPILYILSSNYGATWSSPVNIFADYLNYRTVYQPDLVSNGESSLVATWMAWPIGGSRYGDVFTNFSGNNGLSWNNTDTRFPVTSSSVLAVNPDGYIDMVQAHSYLPFADQIVFYQSTDGGANWGGRSEVTADGFDSNPRVAVDSIDNVDVIYFNSMGYHFNRSIDGGVNWLEPVNLTASDANAAVMALDPAGNIYIIYENGVTGNLAMITSIQ